MMNDGGEPTRESRLDSLDDAAALLEEVAPLEQTADPADEFLPLEAPEPSRRTPTNVALLFIGAAVACIAFAITAVSGRRSSVEVERPDPLLAIAKKPPTEVKPRVDLTPPEVTFPQALSDSPTPTTAMAAVPRTAAQAAQAPTAAAPAPNMPAITNAELPLAAIPAPPSPADRLPVVPLPPAASVRQPTPLVTRPRDALTKLAADSAQQSATAGASLEAGHEGGYQLQVSSFRTAPDAQAFSNQLRARGHKSYVQEAHVEGRGTWFRVRIGPFASNESARGYRTKLEQKEQVVSFVVPPKATK